MEKYELAVVVSNDNENDNALETIDAIKEAGFKNVFIQWYNKDGFNPSQEEQLKHIKEKGLNVIFAHLGYKHINDMWIEEDTGLVEYYKHDIKVCADNGIDMVVMHLTSHSEAPMYGETGLKRIKEIVDYAKSLNVKVAFENTKIKGYLDYVLDNIDNDNVGICFDSGHCHAHFNDELDFNKFKDRIMAVHLHDNDGSEDQHLLPYDGSINWDEYISNLKKANYEGPIVLEIVYHRDYVKMPIVDFYKKGYEIGLKIQKEFK